MRASHGRSDRRALFARFAIVVAVASQAAPARMVAQVAQPASPPLAAPSPSSPSGSLARTSTRVIRVVTWNIGANSVASPKNGRVDLASSTRPAAFARIMRALDPDVICLNELTIGDARVTRTFDAIQPLARGSWHAYHALGNVIVSRYPLEETSSRVLRERFSQRSHAIARVRVPDSVAPRAMLAVCTHLQAKGGAANLAFRERQASAIVRDIAARSATSSRAIALPVVVMGDLNAIDRPAPYLDLLQRGDGSSAFPLADAAPLHNGIGIDRYTWRDDTQPFAPGVLDHILFTASALVARRAFVLNTVTLDTSALTAMRLRRTDVQRSPATGVYDHLPVVVDLEMVLSQPPA